MGASATEGVGLEDAMKWLVDAIATNCLRIDITGQVTKASGALQADFTDKVAYGWSYWLYGVDKVKHWLLGSGQEGQPAQLTTSASWLSGGWQHAVPRRRHSLLDHTEAEKNCRHFVDIFKCFSWMKMYEFRLRFHWSLFLRFELAIFQHWFR